MKKNYLVSVGFVMLAVFLTAQSPLDFTPMAGDWNFKDNRLYQSDVSAGAMVAHIPLKQQGLMNYEFNVRYEGGVLEDMIGGFGFHLFVDKPSTRKNSWGNGDSVLIWLNYDADPYLDEIPAGLSAQVYHSRNNHVMELEGAYSLNKYMYLLTGDVADLTIPLQLKINGVTGQAWITSPLVPSYEFTFNIGRKNLKGDYISLRTNSMAVSFGL